MRDRRQTLTSGLLLAGGVVTSLAMVSRTGKAQGALTPRVVAERFAATLSAHDLKGFGALFADDYVNHQTSAAVPAASGKTAKEATIGFFTARLMGIPDLTVTIEALVADDRRAAASFVYTGTHGGTYFGVAPTGRPLRFTSCDIFEVRDGHIVEHWGMGDLAGVLAQLKS
jgi:steroid delta-isomerase-like uncharacterized protein